MGKDSKLVRFQVITPRSTLVQVSAIAAQQGISKMRLAGELLAQATEILYDEVFGLDDKDAPMRASSFDSDPTIYKSKKRGGE